MYGEPNVTITFWPWVKGQRSLRFRSVIACKGAELGHMLLLYITRKAYTGVQWHYHIWPWVSLKGPSQGRSYSEACLIIYGEAIGVITFYRRDIERSMSRSLRLWRVISCKGAELGHMLLLNTNRKSYMGSPIVPSHLTLSDTERLKLRCWTWFKIFKIFTYMVKYCMRVCPRLQLF